MRGEEKGWKEWRLGFQEEGKSVARKVGREGRGRPGKIPRLQEGTTD